MMSTTLAAGGAIMVDSELRTQAEKVVAEAHDRRMTGVTLRLDDGSVIEAPADLAEFLGQVVNGVSRGAVTVTAIPDELTTTTAAEFLGVTRPTIVKWIEAGELPAHKQGTHRRLWMRDVVAFRETRRRRQREALTALRDFDEAFEEPAPR